MRAPVITFAHLGRLTTPDGLFEHALLAAPRPAHGYCLDDVARGLVVTARQPAPTTAVLGLARGYLGFTLQAQDERGRVHNRRNFAGHWTDEPDVGDHWGRALWGLGTAATASPDGWVRHGALRGAEIGMQVRSPWPRAMAYAAIGAYEVLKASPSSVSAHRLLEDARDMLARPVADAAWPWPEPRLTYANAVLPEALIVIGLGLGDDAALADGLTLLDWLVRLQTTGTHLTASPSIGWQAGEPWPAYDQQPIEISALAEACRRAWDATGESRWSTALDRCVDWFLGNNDVGAILYDEVTGGGYDGLHPNGVNLNQGAESTLAALATFQVSAQALRHPLTVSA